MIRMSEPMRRRCSLLSRILAGTLGAYGLTSLATVGLSLLLAQIGMPRAEAVTAATLVSFGIFSITAMAIFHSRSAPRAWGWLATLALSIALAVLPMLLGGPG